jgi:peptidoglycan/xylan/chitin deacetylase (PgdA/CDA1 family)
VTFGREVFDAVGAFAEALGERVEDNWLAFGVREGLDRLVIAASDAARPTTIGRWVLMDLDVAREAPTTGELPAAVDRVSCDVRWDGELLGTVEVGTADGRLPAPVVADAVAATLAWPLLRRILERDALADVDVERSGSRLRVSRAGRLLADDEEDAGRALGDWLHDHVGWSLLLGELFGEPGMSSDDFFATARRTARRGRAVGTDGLPVTVELTEPLPALTGSGTGAAVAVTLAGVPLTAVRVPLVDGRLAAHDLRRIVLEQTGFELAVAAVREWVLAASHDPDGGLRPRLRVLGAARRASRTGTAGPLAPGWETAAAEALGAGGGTLLGRAPAAPEGTAASRYAVLPGGARDVLVAAAEAAGEAVVGLPGDAPAGTVHVPWAFAPGAAVRRLGDLSAMAAAEFEQLFATQADPWGYESEYERRKYAQTLSLVPDGVGRALELGCAEGHFTQRLATRVGALTATDISAVALARAAERCRAADNLAFEQLDLFAADLPGGNDLVVVSEMLYYLPDPTRLAEIAAKLAGAVAPGGHLLTAHARAVVDGRGPGFDWDIPFGADSIDRALRRHGGLEPVREIETPAYRIQLLRRAGGRRRRALRRRGERRREGAGEMTPEAAAGFLPDGGDVRRGDGPEPVAAERLPILMYHQVAADGPERSARWRLHPDAFEEQLAWLRDNGFHSVSFAQWRAAVSARRAVPGRPVMLTFDDGYADFHAVAAPLLRRHGFSATVFLVTDRVGGENRWDAELGEALPLMGWNQVAELAGQGFEFGSHSATHRPLVSLSPEAAVRDLARSRLTLTERLGRPPASVCYPYGLVDPVLAQRAGGAGFQYGVTTEERSAWPGDQLLRLPRHEVRGGDPLCRFIAQVTS